MKYLLFLPVIACLCSPTSAPTSAPTPQVLAVGKACTYNPGDMERVAVTRRLSLVGTLGGVALREREHLGKFVYLRRPDGLVEGPYRVVDYWCAPPWCPEGARPPDGWALDVGWSTWARWRDLRQGPYPGGCLGEFQVLYYNVLLNDSLRSTGRTGAREY